MNNEHPAARENLRPVTAEIPENCSHPGAISGLLHGFFQMVESNECAYPVALIETDDGQIKEVPALFLRFTDRKP